MADKTVGVLGGMGPKATVDFMNKVIDKTPAEKDQDHIRVIVDNNPKVPDRTEAILNGGKSPEPYLREMAVNLQQMGADVLVMPCNTAHYYYQSVQTSVDIPFINMLESTAKYIYELNQNEKNNASKVGLLATNGTINSEIYQKEMAKYNLQLITPTPHQDQVMEAIYSVKKGELGVEVRERLDDPINYMTEQGAKSMIMGCTEIPVLLSQGSKEGIHFIDPTDVLAEETVAFAKI